MDQNGYSEEEKVIDSALIMELPFTDLYMTISEGHENIPVRWRPDPTKRKETGNYIVPPRFNPMMDEIRKEIIESPFNDGTIQYSGLRLRYSKFAAAEDTEWAAIRAVPLELPDLDNLRLNKALQNEIQSWGRRRGLVLIGGRTGDGKTTTAIASLKYYLEKFGGLAITCEDPIEYQFQGAVSQNGYCLQTEIKNEEDWTSSIRGIMRRRPEYILIGEIRSPEAAEQMLKAATSGHLVFATIHAASAADTLQAILQLAENKLGGNIARSILADRLVGIIHQTLRKDGPFVDAIIPKQDNEDTIRKLILAADFANLNDKQKVSFPPLKPQ